MVPAVTKQYHKRHGKIVEFDVTQVLEWEWTILCCTYIAKTSMVLPLMISFPFSAFTSPLNLPWVESYLNR